MFCAYIVMQSSGVVKHNCRGRVCPALSCKVERRGDDCIRPWGVAGTAPYNKNGSPLPTGTAALTYFLLYQQFASLSNAVCTGCQFSRASVAQASRVNQSTTTASGLPRIKS